MPSRQTRRKPPSAGLPANPSRADTMKISPQNATLLPSHLAQKREVSYDFQIQDPGARREAGSAGCVHMFGGVTYSTPIAFILSQFVLSLRHIFTTRFPISPPKPYKSVTLAPVPFSQGAAACPPSPVQHTQAAEVPVIRFKAGNMQQQLGSSGMLRSTPVRCPRLNRAPLYTHW